MSSANERDAAAVAAASSSLNDGAVTAAGPSTAEKNGETMSSRTTRTKDEDPPPTKESGVITDDENNNNDDAAAYNNNNDKNNNNNASQTRSSGSSGGGNSRDHPNNNNNNKKDETPIEELYDLSKPIPRVEKPNRAEYEGDLAEQNAILDQLKERRAVIQSKIDAAMNGGDGGDPATRTAVQQYRAELTALKEKKQTLLSEKRQLRNQMDGIKKDADVISKQKKDALQNVRFQSIEEIASEIRKLQRRQETTTMTLAEEKKLIKEIDALQNSKQYLTAVQNMDTAMEAVRTKRKTVLAEMSAKDTAMDDLSKQIDAVITKLRSVNDGQASKREAIQTLFQERDAIRQEFNAVWKQRDAVRDEYRRKNNDWYNYQRAVRAQKKMQYEEQKRQRDAEHAAWEAARAAEEAKKIPYEEEQALCEYLAVYLERTYLGGDGDGSDSGTTKQPASNDASGDVVVAVKDDPFAGIKAVGKKNKNADEEEEYFGKGSKGKGKKKKRVRNKKKQDCAAGPFTLSVDTFEQFGLLNLTPPTSVDQVPWSVQQLRDKKEWYRQKPRGSVPTASDIRKANEKAIAAAKQQRQQLSPVPLSLNEDNNTISSKQNQNGNTTLYSRQNHLGNKNNRSRTGGPEKKKFQFSQDEFVPLSSTSSTKAKAASASAAPLLSSSWGQKAGAALSPLAAAAATSSCGAPTEPSSDGAGAAAAVVGGTTEGGK